MTMIAFVGGPADAQESTGKRDEVSFGVTRRVTVANDIVSAVMVVSGKDADSAALANRVNEMMVWALEKVRSDGRVIVRTGNYSARSTRNQAKEDIWMARQELILSSTDLTALRSLLGVLQTKLNVQSVGYSVSRAKRDELEEKLLDEALQAYTARADQIAEGLGFSGYKLVTLRLRAGLEDPLKSGHYNLGSLGDSIGGTTRVAAPALARGTSIIFATADGTVHLE